MRLSLASRKGHTLGGNCTSSHIQRRLGIGCTVTVDRLTAINHVRQRPGRRLLPLIECLLGTQPVGGQKVVVTPAESETQARAVVARSGDV
jgi:hypothetical protein